MEYTVPRHGAAIIAGWLSAAGTVLCLPFLLSSRPWLLMLLFCWLFLCCGILAPRIASGRVRLGGNHLTLRRGVLFPVTRRIPLRFISGCHIVQSPLQRLSGTCVFILYSSGCTTVIPGLRRADAEAISVRLTHGGKLL